MNGVSIAPAAPERMADVWALVDAELLRSRGRPGSVVDHFPGLVAGGGEAVVATHGQEVVACAVWRPFTWRDGGRSRRAAMVGLVVTHARHRGRGLASAVLEEVRTRMVADGVEVAVLWARRHDVYTRLGWRPADPGVRGDTVGDPRLRVPSEVTCAKSAAALAEELLAIHRRCADQHFEREPGCYLTVPPPSDRVSAYVVPGEAYALVGWRGEQQRYVLEIVGASRHLAVLWDAVRAGPGQVVVNERGGSVTQRRLAEEHGLRFAPQELALWLPLQAAAGVAPLPNWHVPWLNRI